LARSSKLEVRILPACTDSEEEGKEEGFSTAVTWDILRIRRDRDRANLELLTRGEEKGREVGSARKGLGGNNKRTRLNGGGDKKGKDLNEGLGLLSAGSVESHVHDG